MHKSYSSGRTIILATALSLVSALSKAAPLQERVEALLPGANAAMQEVHANSSFQEADLDLRTTQIHNLFDVFSQKAGRFSTTYYSMGARTATPAYMSANDDDATRSFLQALDTLKQKKKLPTELVFDGFSVSSDSDGFAVFSLYLYKMRLLMQENWQFLSDLTDKLQCSDTNGFNESEKEQLGYMCMLLTDSVNDPVKEAQLDEEGGFGYYVNAIWYAGRQLASYAERDEEQRYKKKQEESRRSSAPVFRVITPKQHARESALIYAAFRSFLDYE